MRQAKIMYVVRGQHDGTIGVYSNMKLAYNVAMDYLRDYNELTVFAFNPETNKGKNVTASYANVCKKLRLMLHTSITTKNYESSAEIQPFYLNN